MLYRYLYVREKCFILSVQSAGASRQHRAQAAADSALDQSVCVSAGVWRCDTKVGTSKKNSQAFLAPNSNLKKKKKNDQNVTLGV